jgi:hypothetical protein
MNPAEWIGFAYTTSMKTLLGLNSVVILNQVIKLRIDGCDRDRDRDRDERFTKYSQENLWNRLTNLKDIIQSRHI